jgi:hypothetical protein
MERATRPTYPEDSFDNILARTLDDIDKVRAGIEITSYAAMPGGMREITSRTVDQIDKELYKQWGKIYPDLFETNSGSLASSHE